MLSSRARAILPIRSAFVSFWAAMVIPILMWIWIGEPSATRYPITVKRSSECK